ncbi:rhodanese-like domain-containing protein [Rubrivirga sp.]|uniref:rhodanese-like domain-containing protein n=1 Tax=Rubrivirga sp. TaxID=1885344 RepID=UPI003C727A98
MAHSPRFVALVDAARREIQETDVEAVHAALETEEPIVLIDTREPEEWSRGRIPGAIHLSRGVLERDIEGVVPIVDAPIVLYCGGGYRSALAAQSLGKMGYTNVASMDGGWRAWTGAGYPTETA